MENNKREPSLDVLNKLTGLFSGSVYQILNPDTATPAEVTVEDKSTLEQVRLIQQLDEDNQQTVFKIIDTMLTKKKFKDFFQKNIGFIRPAGVSKVLAYRILNLLHK